MWHFLRDREGIYASILAVALVVAVLIASVGFEVNMMAVLVLTLAVLLGSFFGEFRETWKTQQPFSPARVFFRTFEWLSLAVAGYIILSVIGSDTIASASNMEQ